MSSASLAGKIAFLGDFPPRQCGIATFTKDIRDAVAGIRPESTCLVAAVTDPGRSYEYPPEVRFEIAEPDARTYARAADFLNLSNVSLLCVQHEFGIFGGPAGSHLIGLLKRVHMPIVTTLHTVLRDPNPDQRKVFGDVVRLSNRLVIMSEMGRDILQEVYNVDPAKIALIPHGIPDVPFVDPNFYKDQFAVTGRPVILTFGLISPNKGIEYGIEALAKVAAKHPDVVYIILGATHPNLVRAEGETYRLSLERLAKKFGVERNVMFVNRYVNNEELLEFIGAADIYLTPYLHEAQITSGTLAYCFGSGKAVVSTPYWHATELLRNGRGILVPFRDADAIADGIIELLDNPASCHAMRKQAYLLGREMIWKQVAHAYAVTFENALAEFGAASAWRVKNAATLTTEQADLPLWRFDHLLRISDSTGVFQHSIYSVPWFDHGYCTDDNSRALLLTSLLEDIDSLPNELVPLQSAAAAFLQHAMNVHSGRFRNFMSFDRRWLEDSGSEDCHGRAIWALGAIVGRTRRDHLRNWAASLLDRALPIVESFSSPRAWAFTVLGLHEYLRVLHGDLLANRRRIELAQRLLTLFENNRSKDWIWLDDAVTYDNARIPHALILTGRWCGNAKMLKMGLDALRWLQDHQVGTDGCFRPVGSNGFWKRGEAPAMFDQQPIEASATVSACIEAYNATGDRFWRDEATRVFEWFLGSNDLNLTLYDAGNGGCYDGLHSNRVNQNQGAESTLSFLMALADMNALKNLTLSQGTSEVE